MQDLSEIEWVDTNDIPRSSEDSLAQLEHLDLGSASSSYKYSEPDSRLVI